MKNSTRQGMPLPGSRSMTQFRSARIRRVAFYWRHRQEDSAAAAPGTHDDGKSG